MERLIKIYSTNQRSININSIVKDTTVEEAFFAAVRRILAASWEDSESCYPEDGSDVFLRNVGCCY
jgi:hypothetical protein